MRWLMLSLLFLPLVVGCASGGTAGGPSSSSNVITANELAGVTELNTLDAIRRLRPTWLRSRVAATPDAVESQGSGPALRLDGAVWEGLDPLRDLPITDVQEIRFLSATDATTLYGTGYVRGMIEVRTRES